LGKVQAQELTHKLQFQTSEIIIGRQEFLQLTAGIATLSHRERRWSTEKQLLRKGL